MTTSISSKAEIIRKRTDRQADICNYRVVSLLKIIHGQKDIGSCRVEFRYHKKQIEGKKYNKLIKSRILIYFFSFIYLYLLQPNRQTDGQYNDMIDGH